MCEFIKYYEKERVIKPKYANNLKIQIIIKLNRNDG